MCLARAYLKEEGEAELVLEEVALLEVEGKVVRLSTIFGEKKQIEGTVKAIDFQSASVIVERPR